MKEVPIVSGRFMCLIKRYESDNSDMCPFKDITCPLLHAPPGLVLMLWVFSEVQIHISFCPSSMKRHTKGKLLHLHKTNKTILRAHLRFEVFER